MVQTIKLYKNLYTVRISINGYFIAPNPSRILWPHHQQSFIFPKTFLGFECLNKICFLTLHIISFYKTKQIKNLSKLNPHSSTIVKKLEL